MANTKSAAKAARQSLKRKAVNTARTSRIRSSMKAAETAAEGTDKAAAAAALKAMQTELSRGVKHGLVHRNAAARKMSRLSKRVKAIKS